MSLPDSIPQPEELKMFSEPRAAIEMDMPSDRPDTPRGLQALVAELQDAAVQSKDRIIEIEQEKERLANRLELTTAELHSLREREASLRSKIAEANTAVRERDEAVADAAREQKHAQELQEKVDQLTRQLHTASKSKGAGNANAAAEIEMLQKQVASIRQARDGALTQNRELTRQLAAKDDQFAEMEYDRDKAIEKAEAAAKKLEEITSQLDTLNAERQAAITRAETLAKQMEDLMAAVEADHAVEAQVLESLQKDLATAKEERQSTLAQVAALTAELETARAAGNGGAAAPEELAEARAQLDFQQIQIDELLAENEAQKKTIESLNQQIQALKEGGADSSSAESFGSSDEQVAAAQRRSEEHRKLAVELGAQLDGARRQITELTAEIALMRLEAAKAKKAKGGKGGSAEPELEPLTASAAQELLSIMSRCNEAFIKNPSDIELLGQICTNSKLLADRAGVSGMVALQRLGSALASLTRHLQEIPATITSSSVRTTQQTIEFLQTLVNTRDLINLKDPAQAMVFTVDDDLDACETIRMSLKMVLLDTAFTAEPENALQELGSGRFDLIFLDINLPGTDGFELCGKIRGLEEYKHTPVVFITGNNTPQMRAQSVVSGGSDFIAKPFNLQELGVKALTLVVKAQAGIE